MGQRFDCAGGASPACAMPSTLRSKVSVLLVEDNALIGLDAQDMLREIGAGEVHVAHTLEAARTHLERAAVEAVVLDLLIGETRSEDLARELIARKLPFVFASGLANAIQLPEDMGHVPVVAKPYSAGNLAVALRAVGIE